MELTLESPAFADGKPIPRRHSGEGEDRSPPLRWKGAPPGTRELALICDDPDAPSAEPWVHWVLYALRPDLAALADGDDGGGRAGRNGWGTNGWRGPLPPKGHGVHRYVFRLLALSKRLDLPAGATKGDLLRAARDCTIAEAELVGTYERH